MKKIIVSLIIIILSAISFISLKLVTKTNITFNIFDVEINTEHKVLEFIKDIKNGEITNGEESIIFDSLGEKEVNIGYNDYYNKNSNTIIKVKVVDTEKPIIYYKDTITITEGNKVDLLKGVSVTDNSKENIIPEVIGKYNNKKKGTYNLKYSATDSSGNNSTVDFKLIVKEKKTSVKNSTTTKNNQNKYYIKVNKTLNVVMVYSLDNNNEYTKLVKTFVCSAGNNTPTGIYKTDAKAETLYLEGGVWGHYTVRFLKSRGMWFHSVPYFSKPKDGHWNDLEYEEYNKLGTLASKGCIRLAVIDAKWIYQNISNGTTIEIYESDSLPEGVTKPSSIKIDVNSEFKGWDPTDPDNDNPWKNRSHQS